MNNMASEHDRDHLTKRPQVYNAHLDIVQPSSRSTTGAENGKQSPFAKVFGLPELFEAIFLHLPMAELLFAQRVCKQWQTLIQSNTRIQRALFLAPLPPHQTSRFRLQPARFTSMFGEALTVREGKEYWLNPLLAEIPLDELAVDPKGLLNLSSDGCFYSQVIVACRAPKDYPGASWKKMFFSQPPGWFISQYRTQHSKVEDGLVRVQETPIERVGDLLVDSDPLFYNYSSSSFYRAEPESWGANGVSKALFWTDDGWLDENGVKREDIYWRLVECPRDLARLSLFPPS